MKALWKCLWFVLLLSGTVQAEVPVPTLNHRVTDLSNTLNPAQKQELEARLEAFQSSKGSQIAVLILPTTQPETIEQFGIRVVESWKLGRKNVDDGVLLLVAKADRKMRIEVGYGLEGTLNDATAKRIIAEVITPYFKQDQFYEGIAAGVSAIMQVVAVQTLPPPQEDASDFKGLKLLLSGVAIFFLGNILLRKFFGGMTSCLIVAGLIGTIVGLFGDSLMLGSVWAFIVFIASLFFDAQSSNLRRGSRSDEWEDTRADHGGGSHDSGLGGGGGSNDSNFGGGGGRSGGGGASGGW